MVGFLSAQMDVSKNGGTQQPWDFLLKMIILGCFGGTPILETPRCYGNSHTQHTVTKTSVGTKKAYRYNNTNNAKKIMPVFFL